MKRRLITVITKKPSPDRLICEVYLGHLNGLLARLGYGTLVDRHLTDEETAIVEEISRQQKEEMLPIYRWSGEKPAINSRKY